MNNRLFEDDDIVAFDKPSGLIVNRSQTAKVPTLQDFLIEEYPEIYGIEDGDEEFLSRSGIVHRIDKDTSGVLVVAKNPQSFYSLQKQFKKRSTKKEYVAVVLGSIEEAKLEINAPLGRNPTNHMKYAVVTGGRESLTAATKLHEIELDGGFYTVLSVVPVTGRTHQIRVHLASILHPVAVDPIYCTKKQYEQSSQVFPRMMLHAYRLQIAHPKSNDLVQLEAPIPPEFPHFSY